jgi:hypothetical protein
VLDGQGIGTGRAHVSEGSAQIIHRPFMVVLTKALRRPLKTKGAEIEESSAGAADAHGGYIAPVLLACNFGLRT